MRSPSVPTPVARGGSPDPRRVIVLVGGDAYVPTLTSLPADAQVIAADSGLHLADALGLRVDLVVGDLDSVDPDRLAAATRAGAHVERHPVDKDRTDLAIALDAAAAHGPAEVIVIGGHGGRLDHLFAGVLLLAAPAYAASTITAFMGPATVTVVRDRAALHGSPGALVSLVPVHGTCEGVTTRGLRFPLSDETLGAGSSRGVSNVLNDPVAEVRLRSGVLLAIQPGEHGPARDADAPDHGDDTR